MFPSLADKDEGPLLGNTYIYVYILGLHGKVLVAGGLQVWLLWEETRSCPHVRQNQFQPAPRQIHHWPKPRPSAILVLPLSPLLHPPQTRTPKTCTLSRPLDFRISPAVGLVSLVASSYSCLTPEIYTYTWLPSYLNFLPASSAWYLLPIMNQHSYPPLACTTDTQVPREPFTHKNLEMEFNVNINRVCWPGSQHNQTNTLINNPFTGNLSLLSPYPSIFPWWFLHKSS